MKLRLVYCGARTEFTEDEGSELYRELHTCPVCKQQHWREEPEDD